MGYTNSDAMTDSMLSAFKELKAGNAENCKQYLVNAVACYEEINGCPNVYVTPEEKTKAIDHLNKLFFMRKNN